jgi:hypothetical protein
MERQILHDLIYYTWNLKKVGLIAEKTRMVVAMCYKVEENG